VANIETLINQLAQDTAPIRPAPHPFMLSAKWMLAALAYILVSLLISGLRPDLMIKLHELWFVAEIAALIGIFIATALSAALLSFPDLHQMRRITFVPVIMFALFVLVMFLAWRADNPPAPLPVHSFECTISITLFSLLPIFWTFFKMRKLASTHSHLAGCCALLFAFSISAIWIRLHEVNDSIIHVIQWHYLPMIVFSLVGLWLGKVMLKW
jgi:hypothetical protein